MVHGAALPGVILWVVCWAYDGNTPLVYPCRTIDLVVQGSVRLQMQWILPQQRCMNSLAATWRLTFMSWSVFPCALTAPCHLDSLPRVALRR